jgi:hypothetical protein
MARPMAAQRIDMRKGRTSFMSVIEWGTDFDETLARAKAKNRPVLLDFFNPN